MNFNGFKNKKLSNAKKKKDEKFSQSGHSNEKSCIFAADLKPRW